MPSSLNFSYVGLSHKGKVKEANEDSLLMSQDLKSGLWADQAEKIDLGAFGALFLVSDGLGGPELGKKASSWVTAHARTYFASFDSIPEKDSDRLLCLSKCLMGAHQVLVNKIKQDEQLEGMGATALYAWILEGKAYLVWSGDSRAYVYRDGLDPHPLTDDHSLCWEMVKQGELTKDELQNHPKRHVILQHLGRPDKEPQPDGKILSLASGDRLLFCTDGLTKALTDDEIWDELQANENTKDTAENLMLKSLEGPANDNISLVVVDVHSGENKPTKAVPLANKESDDKIPSRFNGFIFVFSLGIIIALVWLVLPRRSSAPIVDTIADTTETILGDSIRMEEIFTEDSSTTVTDSLVNWQIEYQELKAHFSALRMRSDSIKLLKRANSLTSAPPAEVGEAIVIEIKNRADVFAAHLNQLSGPNKLLRPANSEADVRDYQVLVNQLKSEMETLLQFVQMAESKLSDS